MSTQQYRERSLEELEPLIESFINNYKTLFGSSPSQEVINAKLEELKKEKEKFLFDSLFTTLSPKNLTQAQVLFKEKLDLKPIVQKHEEKPKKQAKIKKDNKIE